MLLDVLGAAADLFAAVVALPHLVLAAADQHLEDLGVLALVDVLLEPGRLVLLQFAVQLRLEVLEREDELLALPRHRRFRFAREHRRARPLTIRVLQSTETQLGLVGFLVGTIEKITMKNC